jgi:hypothetical protein
VPTAAEAAGGGAQLQAVLDAGLNELSKNETVTFSQYTRVALSPDSSVFWVKTPTTLTAMGSLHVATDRRQELDEVIGATTAIFSSEQLVSEFVAIAPGTMWIGTWMLGATELLVAFSSRGRFYEEAQIYHYSGMCVYPAMQSQLVATMDDLPTGPIVSNSLPIWLSQTAFAPCYPSFLVDENLVPPYIVAHVEPEGTVAIGGFPLYTWPGTTEPDSGASPLHDLPSTQLMRDEVTLTLYGFTNATAIQYLNALIDFSWTDAFGWANTPAIRDEKRVQVEIAALAQKKTIHVSANYLQWTADAIARRLILEASVSSWTVLGGRAGPLTLVDGGGDALLTEGGEQILVENS